MLRGAIDVECKSSSKHLAGEIKNKDDLLTIGPFVETLVAGPTMLIIKSFLVLGRLVARANLSVASGGTQCGLSPKETRPSCAAADCCYCACCSSPHRSARCDPGLHACPAPLLMATERPFRNRQVYSKRARQRSSELATKLLISNIGKQGSSSANVASSPLIDQSGEDSPRAGRRATWLPPSAQPRAPRSPSAISPRGRSGDRL